MENFVFDNDNIYSCLPKNDQGSCLWYGLKTQSALDHAAFKTLNFSSILTNPTTPPSYHSVSFDSIMFVRQKVKDVILIC